MFLDDWLIFHNFINVPETKIISSMSVRHGSKNAPIKVMMKLLITRL